MNEGSDNKSGKRPTAKDRRSSSSKKNSIKSEIEHKMRQRENLRQKFFSPLILKNDGEFELFQEPVSPVQVTQCHHFDFHDKLWLFQSTNTIGFTQLIERLNLYDENSLLALPDSKDSRSTKTQETQIPQRDNYGREDESRIAKKSQTNKKHKIDKSSIGNFSNSPDISRFSSKKDAQPQKTISSINHLYEFVDSLMKEKGKVDLNDRGRYPSRLRQKPLRYWQCQKVKYQKNKAVGITCYSNFLQLLGVQDSIETITLIDYNTNTVSTEFILEPEKMFESLGYSDPFSQLEVKLLSNPGGVQLSDGFEDVTLEKGTIYNIPPKSSFQLVNKSKRKKVFSLRLIK